MGSPITEVGHGHEETEQNVTLTKGLYLGKYVVTQAEYETVMTRNNDGLSATPSHWSGNPNHPVEMISWDDAINFCNLLTKQKRNGGHIPEGWSYVLPTESEWEYSCRARSNTIYLWGIQLTEAMPITTTASGMGLKLFRLVASTQIL